MHECISALSNPRSIGLVVVSLIIAFIIFACGAVAWELLHAWLFRSRLPYRTERHKPSASKECPCCGRPIADRTPV